MTKWERRAKAAKKKAKREAAARRVDLRAAVKLMAKILAPMPERTTWQKDRAKVIRKALDVLAGEAAQS